MNFTIPTAVFDALVDGEVRATVTAPSRGEALQLLAEQVEQLHMLGYQGRCKVIAREHDHFPSAGNTSVCVFCQARLPQRRFIRLRVEYPEGTSDRTAVKLGDQLRDFGAALGDVEIEDEGIMHHVGRSEPPPVVTIEQELAAALRDVGEFGWAVTVERGELMLAAVNTLIEHDSNVAHADLVDRALRQFGGQGSVS